MENKAVAANTLRVSMYILQYFGRMTFNLKVVTKDLISDENDSPEEGKSVRINEGRPWLLSYICP